jgi:hypothetical protein
MPTLIKLSTNWANEMDIEGFVLSMESKEQIIEKMKHHYLQIVIDGYWSVNDLHLNEEELTAFKKAERSYKEHTLYLKKSLINEMLKQEIEIGIGTNEEINFNGFEDYISQHNLTEISLEEYDTIKKLIGTSFGHYFDFEDYSNIKIISKEE